jgi:hypothetical protein
MKYFIQLIFVLITTNAFGQNWDLSQKVLSSDRRNYDHFGNKVAISGDYTIVGARYQDYDENGQNYLPNSGAAYIYKKSVNGSWNLFQKIVAKDRTRTDYFGYDVNINGSKIIVSAIGESKDQFGDTLYRAGAVYIYSFSDSLNLWVQEAKIKSNNRRKNDYFGFSTAIYENYAVVGKYREDFDDNEKDSLTRAGAAYIFKRDSLGTWTQLQKIVPRDRVGYDIFGYDVDIYKNQIIVGSYGSDLNATGGLLLANAGAAYVYKLQNNIWKEDQKIVASDRSRYDYFGISVVIDSQYAVIGAYAQDFDSKGNNYNVNAGAAYVFNLNSNTWVEKQKITASDRGRVNYFGYTVDVSGSNIAVGAFGNETDEDLNNPLKLAGAAFVYELNSNNTFAQTAKLIPRDRDSNQRIGLTVGISNKYAVIGSYADDKNLLGNGYFPGAGATYFFESCKSFSELHVDACTDYVSPSKNHTWNKTGTYSDIIPNYNGCDSLITIYLNITKPSYDTIHPIVCDYYKTPNGNKLIHSGIYSEIVKSQNGCDNLLTIDLKILRSSYSTIKEDACISYVSPSGKYFWRKGGMYKDTLINSIGCDSILSINLDIHSPSTATHHVTSCKYFKSYSGNHVWNNSGIYKDTIQNVYGCDSFLRMEVTINKVDTGVISLGNKLISTANEAFYQWIKCLGHSEYEALNGESNKTFIPKLNGGYALKIAQNGCVDTTSCYSAFTVGLMPEPTKNKVNIYPNPNNGNFILYLDGLKGFGKVEVFNSLGQVIYVSSIENNTSNEIHFQGIAGFYYLKVSDSDRIHSYHKIRKL